MTSHQSNSPHVESSPTRGTVAMRLAVLVLVPVASLLVAVTIVVLGSWSDIRQADALARAANTATRVGELAYRTQAERGLSVHHLSTADGPISPNLVTARDELDKALEAVRVDASGDVDPELSQALTSALTTYESLATVRQQVEARSIDPDTAIASYSKGVDATTAAVEQMLPLATDAHATRQVTSLRDQLAVA